jgi:hypothetical protein
MENTYPKGDVLPLKIFKVNSAIWEEGIDNYQSSLFNTVEWVQSMSNDKCSPIFLDFLSDKEVVAKVSGLICNDGWVKGVQLYCYASPALKREDPKLLEDCYSSLLKYAVKNRIARVVIGSYDQQHSLVCHPNGFFKTERCEYVVNLQTESISMSKGFRKNVSKAKKQNFTVESDASEAMFQELCRLLEVTRNHRLIKFGVRYNPYFLPYMNEASLLRLLKTGIVDLLSIKKEQDQAYCVQLNLVKQNRVYGLLMGSDSFAYDNGFPSLIDYDIIMDSKHKSFHYYNTGGVPGDEINEGLDRYKQSMGGERVMVYGATTNYLIFPYSLLNPLMNAGRRLPRNNAIVSRIKKMFY